MSARLLALLFPSWKLFDWIEEPFILEIRLHGESNWKEALPPLGRPWYALFHDPEGNLKRASQSLVDRLVHELSTREPSEITATAEFKQVWALARERGGAKLAQFQIRQEEDIVLRSEEFG